MTYDVIIIGGGCAGLTAGIYCGRADLKTLIFCGGFDDKGGMLSKTSDVENFPGFPDGILGYDLVANMEKQAVKYSVEIKNEYVCSISKNDDIFSVSTDTETFDTKTIIICTGTTPRKLGLENEDTLWSHGISSCAVCDGALYKKKKIVVVGGGDSAMEEALFLTKFSDVILIHRKDTLRASKIMQNRVLSNKKITIYYNTVVTKLNGTNKLESINIKNLENNNEEMLEVNGLFYGLGSYPNTEKFKDLVDLDENGYIIVGDEEYKTVSSVRGIFAAGDVHDTIYRQAITAAGFGCQAGLDVIKYINNELKESV